MSRRSSVDFKAHCIPQRQVTGMLSLHIPPLGTRENSTSKTEQDSDDKAYHKYKRPVVVLLRVMAKRKRLGIPNTESQQ